MVLGLSGEDVWDSYPITLVNLIDREFLAHRSHLTSLCLFHSTFVIRVTHLTTIMQE